MELLDINDNVAVRPQQDMIISQYDRLFVSQRLTGIARDLVEAG